MIKNSNWIQWGMIRVSLTSASGALVSIFLKINLNTASN
jgi:hypothetical protein